MSSFKQVLIALDQLANTMVWIKGDGFGFADETLSARAWRLRAESNAHKVIDFLFFWEDDHCLGSYQSEKYRNQLPEEYQKKIQEARKLKE